MNEQHTGFRPLNCNPHHELLLGVRHSLAECSSGDRTLVFETRERLHELTARIEEGPWSMLTALTGSVEVILGHLLRRGNLDVPEVMQVATDIMGFVDRALTLSPPEGSRGTTSSGAKQKIAIDRSEATSKLKLKLTSVPHASAAGAGSPRTTVTPEPEEGESPEAHGQRGKRKATDFGNVAYQMVNESRLGELLIKMGRIQPAQLDRALVLQKLSRKRLGDVLMAMEAVDLRGLQAALEVQRQETLRFTDERSITRPGQDGPALGRAS